MHNYKAPIERNMRTCFRVGFNIVREKLIDICINNIDIKLNRRLIVLIGLVIVIGQLYNREQLDN